MGWKKNIFLKLKIYKIATTMIVKRTMASLVGELGEFDFSRNDGWFGSNSNDIK